MAGKRLTRKEIQEDQIGDALQDTYSWITENRNTIIVGIVVLLAMVAASYAYRGYRQSQNAELQVALNDAMKVLEAPLSGEEPVVEPGHEGHDHATVSELTFETAEERDRQALERFQQISQEYSGPIAQFADFYAAVANDRLGNTAEAQETLRRLSENAGNPEVRSLSLNYLALIGEREQNWDQVIASLQELADSESETFPRETALFRLGRAQEASGNRREALETYRKVAAEYPQGANFRAVNARIDVLSAVLGEPAAEEESPEESAS